MRIIARYSFNNGEPAITSHFPSELGEIEQAIAAVDASKARTKASQERTKPGQILYSPIALNRMILAEILYKQGWSKPRINYDTVVAETGEQYKGFIEGDGVKNGLGIEVQFGKYAFLGWDVFGKMPIFARRAVFSAGVEVVPMRRFRGDMSTGIGCFEQIKGILEARGASNIDIPVLILGIAPDVPDGQDVAIADEDTAPDAQ